MPPGVDGRDARSGVGFEDVTKTLFDVLAVARDGRLQLIVFEVSDAQAAEFSQASACVETTRLQRAARSTAVVARGATARSPSDGADGVAGLGAGAPGKRLLAHADAVEKRDAVPLEGEVEFPEIPQACAPGARAVGSLKVEKRELPLGPQEPVAQVKIPVDEALGMELCHGAAQFVQHRASRVSIVREGMDESAPGYAFHEDDGTAPGQAPLEWTGNRQSGGVQCVQGPPLAVGRTETGEALQPAQGPPAARGRFEDLGEAPTAVGRVHGDELASITAGHHALEGKGVAPAVELSG